MKNKQIKYNMTIGVIIIALIVVLFLAASLPMSAGVAAAAVVDPTPQDVKFDMPGYGEIYSATSTLTQGAKPSLYTGLQKAQNEFFDSFDEFEYLLKIELDFDRVTYDNTFNFLVQFWNEQDEENPPYELDIRAINNSDSSVTTALLWGYYNPNGLANCHEAQKNITTSKIYLRVTGAEISITFVWDPTSYGYNESKPYQTISFKADSKQYTDIFNLLKDEHTKCSLVNFDQVTPDNHASGTFNPNKLILTESFKIYMKSLPLPEEPTREGYTFTGWFYDAACTRPYGGEPLLVETALYPGWKINTYHVYFNVVENATGVFFDTVVNWNTTATCPQTPEYAGHVFSGWTYEDGTPYTGQGIKADTHLYATWDTATYKITFDTTGGELISDMSVKHGQSIANLPTPTREGFTFVGWTFAEGIDVFYDNQPITSDTTLFAVWKAVIVKVTFYMNNNIYRQINVAYGTTLLNACTQARVSPTLAQAYYSESNSTEQTDVDSAVLKENTGVILKAGDKGTDISDDDNNDITDVKSFGKYLAQHKWAAIVLGVVTGLVVFGIIAVIVVAVKRRS